MLKLNFTKVGAGNNDDLLHQVRTVLADIPLSEIRCALGLAHGGSNPFDIRTDSIRLLYYYQIVSHRRRRPVAFFLGSAVSNPLRALMKTKADLEAAAPVSVLFQTALDIIEEFMVCLDNRDQLTKRSLAQRRILKNNYAKFFRALDLRDGKQCSDCKSKRKKLEIDHIRPVAKGGLTELVNLELRCFSCNSKKSDTFNEE